MKFSLYSAEHGGGAGKPNKKKALKKLQNLVLSDKQDLDFFRKNIDSQFFSAHVPAQVEIEQKIFEGIHCDILTPVVASSNRIILYVHGGGFIGGSNKSWRSFCASLASESSCRLLFPNFRLAPQHPYPASLEDLQLLFKELYIFLKIKNITQIILAADGSGASIALAFFQELSEFYRHIIKGIILFSPWLTLDTTNLVKNKKNTDGIISVDNLLKSGELYTYPSNLTNPLISPLFMPDKILRSLPPVYIQGGGAEFLLPTYKSFYKKLQEGNIPTTLDIWPNMMFMFQMAHEYIPQAHLAIQRIGKYIQQNYK